MPWADAVAGPADQAHRLCQRIAQATGGRIRVVPSFGVADGLAAVRAGEADLYFASAHDNVEAHRGFAYFAGLPGDRGLSPQHLQTWISLGGGQALWDELAGDLGIKPLLAAHTGSRSYLLATERIDSMSRPRRPQGACRGARARRRPRPRPRARQHRARRSSRAPCSAAKFSRPNAAAPSPATRWACTPPHPTGRGRASIATARRCRWPSAAICGSACPTAEQAALAAAAAAEYQLSLAEEEAHRHMLFPEPPAGAHLAARRRAVARHPPRRRCRGGPCRRRRRPNAAYQRQLRRLPPIRAGRRGHPGGLTPVSFGGASL